MENQKGVTHLFLLFFLAAVGLIIYFLVSSSFPFKDKLFSNLYPKPVSRASQGPSVTVEARFYPDVKNQLLAGDLLTMPAVRQASDSAMTADHWKFQKAITALNNVNKNEIGVKKGIFLSAVDDVKNLIGSIPSDVDWIIYNMESGMTPSADFADPVSSVKQFADIVRSSGRKMGFAPTRTNFDQYQGTVMMSDVLNSVDLVYYQGQLLLPDIGEDAFVQTVQGKYSYVKSVNPNVQFYLQLWLVRQTPQEMISAFNRLPNLMDNAVIGAASGLDLTSQVQEVLSGLSWRQQPTPTPDTAPPAVSITNPTSGASVKWGTTINITADASDNVAVTTVEFYINNSLQCTDTATPYSCSWNVPRGKKTGYTLGVKAYDQANNTSSTSILVTTGNK